MTKSSFWQVGVFALLVWAPFSLAQKGKERPVVLEQLSEFSRNNIKVFKEAAPKVVFVHNLKHMADPFSYRVTEVQQGTGSGFIWDQSGHVVTNFHVINGADQIAVSLQHGGKYRAKIIGVEPRKDLAVLKIDLDRKFDKPFVDTLADSSTILVGQKAIAIGNPFGLDHTFTVGSISALGRSVESIGGVTIRDMVQTDAAINPGNSGGPLLDERGFLLGVNTAIYSRSGSSAGIGFAVPANTVNRVVSQIITHGKVIQPGIGFGRLDDGVAQYLGIQGVIVGKVFPGTPAAKAGLRGTNRNRFGEIDLGDVIVAINDQPVRNYDDLYNALEKHKPGDTVTVKFLRAGKQREAKVELTSI